MAYDFRKLEDFHGVMVFCEQRQGELMPTDFELVSEARKLADDLVYLFRECEKYSDISQKIGDSEKNEAYSFDMVTNRGTSVRTQTYVLPEKDKSKADDLEQKINKLLSGDNNIDVCALLSILNKKMSK